MDHLEEKKWEEKQESQREGKCWQQFKKKKKKLKHWVIGRYDAVLPPRCDDEPGSSLCGVLESPKARSSWLVCKPTGFLSNWTGERHSKIRVERCAQRPKNKKKGKKQKSGRQRSKNAEEAEWAMAHDEVCSFSSLLSSRIPQRADLFIRQTSGQAEEKQTGLFLCVCVKPLLTNPLPRHEPFDPLPVVWALRWALCVSACAKAAHSCETALKSAGVENEENENKSTVRAVDWRLAWRRKLDRLPASQRRDWYKDARFKKSPTKTVVSSWSWNYNQLTSPNWRL